MFFFFMIAFIIIIILNFSFGLKGTHPTLCHYHHQGLLGSTLPLLLNNQQDRKTIQKRDFILG